MTNIEVTITQPVIEVRFESTLQTGGGGAVDSVNGQTGDVVLTTTDINEGTNLYFTNARAIAALAATLLNYVTTTALNTALSAYVTAVSLASTLANYLQKNAPITGATKTKITYDANGLVTSGTDATTADINDSSNRRYVTDAQLTVIGNTSGTNTGDNAVNTTSNSYADGKVADAINDGVTTIAPSQNAVFDALTGKQNSLGFTPENVANKATTFTTLNDTLYPSVEAVNEQINLKTGTTAYITVGDVTTTSSASSNITGLSFAVEANKMYRVFGILRIGCNNTGGVNIGSTFPAGTTLNIIAFGNATSSTTFKYRLDSSGAIGGLFNGFNNASGFVMLLGEVFTSGTAGNIQFQFGSGVNLQTSTVFELGTWLNITEL